MDDSNKIYHAIEFVLSAEKYLALLEFQAQLWGDFPRMWENPSYYIFQDAIWHSERN